MSKKSRFSGWFEKQYGKRAQPLLNSASQHPYQLSWNKSLLLTCKMLELLVNILAAEEKYPVLKRDSLTIPIQIQLYQTQKTFLQFFAAFFKSRLNFKHFE